MCTRKCSKYDFHYILSQNFFSKTINFDWKSLFEPKRLFFHRAKQRKATKPSFSENSAFSASRPKNRFLRKVEEKKLWRFEKNRSEKIFKKKNFFHENRNFLDSGVIFLGNFNPKIRLELSFLSIMNQLRNIQSIT